MDGVQGIEAEETSLDCPSTEDTFIDVPVAPPVPEATEEAAAPDPDQPSDENLWSRSRDFDAVYLLREAALLGPAVLQKPSPHLSALTFSVNFTVGASGNFDGSCFAMASR